MNHAATPPNLFLRWCRFNLVGALGMLVQLTALALFDQLSGGRYLFATAAAVELTLLHNFVWHLRYTWLDRSERTSTLAQLLRFHLSNGLVSLLGNLFLMHFLVGGARLPLVPANILAIVACSLINFFLGHSWVFAPRRRAAVQ